MVIATETVLEPGHLGLVLQISAIILKARTTIGVPLNASGWVGAAQKVPNLKDASNLD